MHVWSFRRLKGYCFLQAEQQATLNKLSQQLLQQQRERSQVCALPCLYILYVLATCSNVCGIQVHDLLQG